jgi:hypothetical protein
VKAKGLISTRVGSLTRQLSVGCWGVPVRVLGCGVVQSFFLDTTTKHTRCHVRSRQEFGSQSWYAAVFHLSSTPTRTLQRHSRQQQRAPRIRPVRLPDIPEVLFRIPLYLDAKQSLCPTLGPKTFPLLVRNPRPAGQAPWTAMSNHSRYNHHLQPLKSYSIVLRAHRRQGTIPYTLCAAFQRLSRRGDP